MLHFLPGLVPDAVNPITCEPYDPSWIILMVTYDSGYRMFCGCENGSAYIGKISRTEHPSWCVAAGDFISFHESLGMNIIISADDDSVNAIKACCSEHTPWDRFLREDEPCVMLHSTTPEGWRSIRKSGMLLSWNRVRSQNGISEEEPIGKTLGDPMYLRDFILLGTGVTGEIVVSSREKGRLCMDISETYRPGARLYLDASKLAADGLLVRDGLHWMVRDALPLEPYLLFAATTDAVGIAGEYASPSAFADAADRKFSEIFRR